MQATGDDGSHTSLVPSNQKLQTLIADRDLAGREALSASALSEKVQDCTATVYAENTRRAYLSDWKSFENWCKNHDLCPCPCEPQTVGAYLADHSERLKHSSLKRHLSAISAAQRQAGHKLDTRHLAIYNVIVGIRNTYSQPVVRKKPLLTKDILSWCSSLGDSIQELRDKAMLLLGFAAALRRSELVALDICQSKTSIGWIELKPEGLLIQLTRSKTHSGELQTIAVPYGKGRGCPVRAVKLWIDTAKIFDGPLFRRINSKVVTSRRLSSMHVARTVKKVAAFLGKDVSEFSGHSLRAGFVTQAALSGAREWEIQKQTRHKSLDVLRVYIRDGLRWKDGAASKLGL